MPRGTFGNVQGLSDCHSFRKTIASGIWWEKPEIMPNTLKSTGCPTTAKNNLAQNVNSAEVEKLTHSTESGSKRMRKKRNSGTTTLQSSLNS